MDSCCCIDFDGYNDVCDSSVVKARKQHKCCECDNSIEVGSIYKRTSVLFDGSWSKYKTCARCANVASEFMKCGYHFGGLTEDFEDCYEFDYRNGIPKDFAPCKTTGSQTRNTSRKAKNEY